MAGENWLAKFWSAIFESCIGLFKKTRLLCESSPRGPSPSSSSAIDIRAGQIFSPVDATK